MKEDMKDKWFNALSNKNYEPGWYKLRTKMDTYDPLGVLCDILKNRLAIIWTEDKVGNWYFGEEMLIPPKVVLELTGISLSEVQRINYKWDKELVGKGRHKYNFKSIIKVIDKMISNE